MMHAGSLQGGRKLNWKKTQKQRKKIYKLNGFKKTELKKTHFFVRLINYSLGTALAIV